MFRIQPPIDIERNKKPQMKADERRYDNKEMPEKYIQEIDFECLNKV